jgi:hypothetical protein
MRPIASVGPPAEAGTIIETGRDGYVCAAAERATAESPAALAAIFSHRRRGEFMKFPSRRHSITATGAS